MFLRDASHKAMYLLTATTCKELELLDILLSGYDLMLSFWTFLLFQSQTRLENDCLVITQIIKNT